MRVVFRVGGYHEKLLERAAPRELEELLARWARLAVEYCPHELAVDLLGYVEELHDGRFEDGDITAVDALCAAASHGQGEREERIGGLNPDEDPEWAVLSGLRVAAEVLLESRVDVEAVTWVGVCATVCADVPSSLRGGTDMVEAMRLLWGIDWSVELHEVAFGLLPDWEGTIGELWSTSARLVRPAVGGA